MAMDGRKELWPTFKIRIKKRGKPRKPSPSTHGSTPHDYETGMQAIIQLAPK
jgi:hypothetical protein